MSSSSCRLRQAAVESIPVIWTRLRVKPRTVLAIVYKRPASCKLEINLAGIGPRWRKVERAMGIEPTAQAWEAWVLPLYDARLRPIIARSHQRANYEPPRGALSSAEPGIRPLPRSRPANPPGKRPHAGTRWKWR